MKKILLGLLVLMTTFVSCTDQEDIELVFHHNIPVEVNTLDLYQNSGIDVVKFQTLMGTKIYKPLITILVYNPDGTLNQKSELITDDLRPISCILNNLDEKEYTIITVQHFVIVYNDEVSTSWKLEEEENINTVHLSVSSLIGISWIDCLGLDVQKIAIKRNTSLNISTKLAGSFVDFQYENLDKSDYNRLGLYFKDKADGIYLNPEFTGNDRYYYKNGFNAPNRWSSVAVFSADEVLKASDSMTRFIFESGRINYCFGLSDKNDVLGNGSITFTPFPSLSSYCEIEPCKRYKAFCYYNGGQEPVNTFIGGSDDFAKWYDALEKWQAPIYETPYTTWGASVEDVKTYMSSKGYSIWYDVIENTQMGVFNLGYIGKYSENNIQYIFKTRTNDLMAALVFIEHSKSTPSKILEMFTNDESYSKVDLYDQYYEEYGCYIFVNEENQVEIYPNLSYDDGTPITQIAYVQRTYPEYSKLKSNVKYLNGHKQ